MNFFLKKKLVSRGGSPCIHPSGSAPEKERDWERECVGRMKYKKRGKINK
jgi:hypothetical protein